MHAAFLPGVGQPWFLPRVRRLNRAVLVLMKHCVDLGWRETNPVRGVPELKTVKKEREPWPRDLLDVYRAACDLGTRERLVMELCVGTGQRIGDVLGMRWSDIQDGGFVVRQSKTGKELWVPILRGSAVRSAGHVHRC